MSGLHKRLKESGIDLTKDRKDRIFVNTIQQEIYKIEMDQRNYYPPTLKGTIFDKEFHAILNYLGSKFHYPDLLKDYMDDYDKTWIKEVMGSPKYDYYY